MNEQQRTLELLETINAAISKRDVAGFLYDEIQNFLKNLNSWKLEKLEKNLWMFKKYVYLLDEQHTKQIDIVPADDYYISRRWKEVLSKKKKHKEVSLNHVVKVSSAIKAMFLFQAAEFCNGSRDRMKVIDFAKIRASLVQKCRG